MLETELPNLGLGWEATVGETPETVPSKERKSLQEEQRERQPVLCKGQRQRIL